MMKDILYRDWVYLFLALILIFASIYAVTTFNHGFFTAVDEGYFLIKLKEAYEGGIITGKSQWNLIAVHWFPYLDLTSKANSYLASCILRWFTIIIFTVTCCVIFRKESFFKYFALFLLVYFSYGQDFGLSYVPMQTCVLSWALCAYLLFQYFQKCLHKALLLVICGFCLCLSGFIIITGAIVLTPLFVTMIIINAKNDIRQIAFNILYLFCGGVLCLAYMHFVICPLNDVVDAMLSTAQYISKSGHNYDGVSFMRSYFEFFRKLLLIVFYVVGVFFVSSLFKNKIVFSIVYIIAIVFFYFAFPIMGVETKYILLISVAVIPVFFYGKVMGEDRFATIPEERLLVIFLFLFPILAPLGTNCPLEVRMPHYTASWMFIFFYYEYKQGLINYRILLVPLIFLMLIPVYHIFKSNWNYDDRYHFTKGNRHFSEVALTAQQFEYFNNIYEILEKYGYRPGTSVLFTTIYDYSTLYAIDAKNSTNFYQTENFHFFDKKKMLSPDFVILCPYDSTIIGKELKEMPWGWPDDFDAYDIGNPETPNKILPDFVYENRRLYCRRFLRLKN